MSKPVVNTQGLDGNIFSVVAECKRVLREAGQKDKGIELQERVFKSSGYDEALQICMEYVDFKFGRSHADEGDLIPCYGCGEEYPEDELREGYCESCYEQIEGEE